MGWLSENDRNFTLLTVICFKIVRQKERLTLLDHSLVNSNIIQLNWFTNIMAQ